MAGTVTHSWVRIDLKKLPIEVRDRLLRACEGRLSYEVKTFSQHHEIHPDPIPNCPLCQSQFDGIVRLYWVYDNTLRLPTGLAPYLSDVLAGITLRDLRVWDAIKVDGWAQLPSGVTLRDYQVRAVRALLQAKRGMLAAPTGSGKTAAIGAALIYACPKPVLWICHTIALAEQTRQTLSENLKMPVGLIGAGKEQPADVTVALIQSLWSKKLQLRNYFPQVKTLIVDECHHSAARTYFKVIQSCYNAGYRFGLSATPYRNEEGETLWLIGAIGRLVEVIDHRELASLKFIAEPTVYFISLKPLTLTTGFDDWHDAYNTCIVYNPLRNSLTVSAAVMFKPTLILVWSVAHGQLLERMAKDRGLRAMFVHGEHNAAIRMKAIKDLNEGRLDILIASDIFKEGVDIPTVPTLINAAGQKSKVATIQRIGRALRPKPPHNKALIIDFIDGNEPLKRHSLQRFKALSALFPTFIAETLSDITQQMSPMTLNF